MQKSFCVVETHLFYLQDGLEFVWLTGEAAWFATPDGVADLALPYATPAAELLDTVLKAGLVTLCSQCAARRMITEDDVITGVRIAGATTFVAETMADGAQALVY